MWIAYSLISAVFAAFNILIIKKLTQRNKSPLAVMYASLIINTSTMFLLLFFMGGVPVVTTNFYIYMGISGFLDTIAFVCFYYAINISSISHIAPISAFGPVFTTFLAIFALHEIPTPMKFVGILLVVIGAYLLNIASVREGIMEPFKRLFSNKGVLLYLLANVLWGITPIFQKKAIFETTPQIPLYASIMGMFFGIIFLTPFALGKTIKFIKEIKASFKLFAVAGVGVAISQAAAYQAMAMVFVGYATSIFRISSLFTIILGGIFLKEQKIKEKMLGASVMVLGAILLAV
jgi:drug/metabolite transporter (DMT)-like permease